jgi:hypothetical protein
MPILSSIGSMSVGEVTGTAGPAIPSKLIASFYVWPNTSSNIIKFTNIGTSSKATVNLDWSTTTVYIAGVPPSNQVYKKTLSLPTDANANISISSYDGTTIVTMNIDSTDLIDVSANIVEYKYLGWDNVSNKAIYPTGFGRVTIYDNNATYLPGGYKYKAVITKSTTDGGYPKINITNANGKLFLSNVTWNSANMTGSPVNTVTTATINGLAAFQFSSYSVGWSTQTWTVYGENSFTVA